MINLLGIKVSMALDFPVGAVFADSGPDSGDLWRLPDKYFCDESIINSISCLR
jgi:hypothetical protein